MSEILHLLYLPFTQERLRDHFAPAGTEATSADAHLAYYVKSAQAAKDWAELPLSGPPGEVATARKHGLQIQKDERFWVVTALMSIFHAPGRVPVLAEMLQRCLGEVPPIEGLATWEQALGDPQQLKLYFEVSLPTPKGYRKYLVDRLPQRVLVPYVLESATRDSGGRACAGGRDES